jgi:hypothetical protein
MVSSVVRLTTPVLRPHVGAPASACSATVALSESQALALAVSLAAATARCGQNTHLLPAHGLALANPYACLLEAV